jgi:hypothetical protein
MRWPYNFQSGLVCVSYSFRPRRADGLFKLAHFRIMRRMVTWRGFFGAAFNWCSLQTCDANLLSRSA